MNSKELTEALEALDRAEALCLKAHETFARARTILADYRVEFNASAPPTRAYVAADIATAASHRAAAQAGLAREALQEMQSKQEAISEINQIASEVNGNEEDWENSDDGWDDSGCSIED